VSEPVHQEEDSAKRRGNMINFEEELKKFHPSLEVEDAEDAIYNQDMTDMADLVVKVVKESKDLEEETEE
jgi:hypothetical protein